MLKHFGGFALLAGALLNMTRMIPTVLSDGFSRDILPPKTVDDLIIFTKLSGFAPSHMMALFSTPLLIFGITVLFKVLWEQGQRVSGLAGLVLANSGFVLYLLAAITDGIVLPGIINEFAADPLGGEIAISVVHSFATGLAGAGAALILFGVGFIGFGFFRAKHAIFGALGVLIGAIAFIGYITSILKLDFIESFQILGPLMMLTFAYLLANGLYLVRINNKTKLAESLI
jgi:hypothetical protein